MFPGSSKKKKGGASIAFPDVCKVPAPPAPFVPVPFPNIQIASSNFKSASVKIEKFKTNFKKTKGDEAGTAKGVTASIAKMATIFARHSVTVKATGKKASKLMFPNQAAKVFQQAQKQQKTFESQLKKECSKLLKACKDDKDQQKLAKTLISMVGSAARGHPV
ncbi:DUF4150 domain-containing protein [Parasedimentitalea maritima]|uniref:DUF4150 domain-containing protein n=1 Tax=Parasedimentitalea maritima TaxID=2578117 RepID=A0ABY2V0V2_9RHOB|nr:PAAR-like domain-containing protein [Zongyanglinia marina]TLP69002.1 DUF4150 domain-containing protein [Zongyanglinia marina]